MSVGALDRDVACEIRVVPRGVDDLPRHESSRFLKLNIDFLGQWSRTFSSIDP